MTSFLSGSLHYLLGAIVVIVPLSLLILSRFWQKKDVKEDVNSLACLLVQVPREVKKDNQANEPLKDFKDLIAPMEQLYSSLTTVIHQRNWLDWLFSSPAHISFEIVSIGNVISFYVVCPKRIKDLVERQVHSYFTYAEISRVKAPAFFSQESPAIAGVAFELAKSYVLPFKTYQSLETDPLSAITTALTKLQGQGNVAVQLLIRPISENWRVHTAVASQRVMENKTHLVNRSATGRTVGLIADALKKPAPVEAKPLSAQQEELLKGLQAKGDKVGFEAILRVVATGPDQAAADNNLNGVIAAFSQFHAPQFNSLKYRRLSSMKLGRDYLLRLFSGSPKMILNVEELASIFHLPNRSLETPGVKWQLARALPAPANLPEEGIVLGKSVYRGVEKLVRLKQEDRRRHLFMIGKTGTGKTTLFENMIEQDMHEGKGLCFIDPLGDSIESLIKKVPTDRAQDVILFDPSDTANPLGLNLLEYQRSEERDFLIQEVIEIFYKLFDPNRTGIVGPQWEHWARNAALTVMSQPEGGSLIDLPRLFTDDTFRSQAISYVRDPVVKAFWDQQLAKTADFHKSEMYNYFISKFGRFMTNDLMRNIIGQKKSSFNFRQAMDEGKILLINLAKGKIGEINSNLLGLVIISKIQVAAFSRADITEEQRKDFYLYVDEFQNFTTDTFATILAEARKYRLCLNITNQYFAQLTEKIRDAVIGNVGTLVSYRIGAEDADYLVHEMPGLVEDDLTNLDRFQMYVKLLVDLAPTRPFSMTGIKSPNPGSSEMASWIKQATRVKYSMPPVNTLAPVASSPTST